MSEPWIVFGVSTTFAWDVVEACIRATSAVPLSVANVPGADPELPGLVGIAEVAPDEMSGRSVVVAPSSPRQRRATVEAAEWAGISRWRALADPTAVVARTSDLGSGSFVNAGSVIGSRTFLGRHTVVNRSVSVGHHNRWDDFVCTGPGAVTCGGVVVGAGAFLGAGCVVLPDVRIGVGATVGAGAVVTKDVVAHSVVVGNPARVVPCR